MKKIQKCSGCTNYENINIGISLHKCWHKEFGGSGRYMLAFDAKTSSPKWCPKRKESVENG